VSNAVFEVIASREFDLRVGAETHVVRLEIGKPHSLRDAEWCCDVRVHTPDGIVERRYFGVDSLQALYIGFRAAEQELECLKMVHGATITFVGQDDLWAGLQTLLPPG
jgi:hypothetical protein